MKPYQPTPLDTSKVTLCPEIEALTEQLAENIHDRWAMQRFADGWSYGLTRNDEQKHHPCLIPYADLPETEKIYDRQTAMETLKAIITLGYVIEKIKMI
jgi:hypothetical protein